MSAPLPAKPEPATLPDIKCPYCGRLYGKGYIIELEGKCKHCKQIFYIKRP